MRKILIAVLTGIIRVEKQVFFLTGYQMPALRKFWKMKAEKLQLALDAEHEKKRNEPTWTKL